MEEIGGGDTMHISNAYSLPSNGLHDVKVCDDTKIPLDSRVTPVAMITFVVIIMTGL